MQERVIYEKLVRFPFYFFAVPPTAETQVK